MTNLDLVAREALLANGFQPDLGDEVRAELSALRDPDRARKSDVRDLRSLLWSSIDNVTSRDLDQIEVAEETADGGIVLRVGIADVDALVPKGSAIDMHALANATSVYTGVDVYPMLPEELSTDRTSLNEGEDRLVIVAEQEIGADGVVRRREVYRALATNHAKLDYETIGAWLEGRGAGAGQARRERRARGAGLAARPCGEPAQALTRARWRAVVRHRRGDRRSGRTARSRRSP